jgi:methyl-accepting chemotaxis protein-2 (aspartate sensor receptor)
MSGLTELLSGVNNLSVGKKLTAGFILIFFITLAIAGTGINGFAKIRRNSQKQQTAIRMVQRLNQAQLSRTLLQYTGNHDYAEENAQALEQLKKLSESLESFSWLPEGQMKLNAVRQAENIYRAERELFISALNQRAELLKTLNSNILTGYSVNADKLSDQINADTRLASRASRLDADIQHVLQLWPDFIKQPTELRKKELTTSLHEVTEGAGLLSQIYHANENDWIAEVAREANRLSHLLDTYQKVFNEQESKSAVLTAAAEQMNEAINALYLFQVKQVEETIDDAGEFAWTATVLGILAGLLIAWRITLNITQPLRETLLVADKIAAGDLTTHIETNRRDEPGQLMQAIGRMNDNLKEIITQVRQGVDSVAHASSEIAAGNVDLSSRTEQQSAAVVETAASMHQLTSTVKQNADNAHQASVLAKQASHNAGRGGQLVQEVVVTMEEISTSSKKIADIISVINGIAFQTNILALNAAVEAARAGEQGRGFAVVAGEVRNLAQRSATAAREIEALISEAGEKVENGARLVSNAGHAMEDIVCSVNQVSSIMNEIDTASEEQSRGILQIGQAMSDMDSTTQQNAALVEQSSAAAAALEEQAKQLEKIVAVFKTAEFDISLGEMLKGSALALRPVAAA